MKKSELRQLIKEEISKALNEVNSGLKFRDVKEGNTYTTLSKFSVFEEGDKVNVVGVKTMGQEVVLKLKNSKTSLTDTVRGDLGEEVEVFG